MKNTIAVCGIAAGILCAVSLAVIGGQPAIRAVEAPFCIGGDISSLPEVEKNGGVHRDADGPGDLLELLKMDRSAAGRIRLRVGTSSPGW